MKQEGRYLAYLLRLWQESSGSSDPPLWRASLQRPQSDEVQGFASLGELFAFLENETRSSLPGSQDSEEEGK
jgi:hypothetical protein